MKSVENTEGSSNGDGLVGLAPELVHKVALSGWLAFEDVRALAMTCKRMKTMFVDDAYGRDIHYALKGVMENVRAKRWVPARYAVRRRWFVGEDGGEESVWKGVAAIVVEIRRMVEGEEELGGWENVMMAALSLPGAKGCLETWDAVRFGGTFKTSLLHAAANVGSERVVEWVVERVGDLGVQPRLCVAPLFAACMNGHLGVVKRLVEGGADVMMKNENSENVLHAACQRGHLELARYLAGLWVFDVEDKDGDGQTPLHAACVCGNLDVVKMLVEEIGADVDVDGRDPKGALFWACRSGNPGIVRLLVDAGAGSGIEKDQGVWVRGLEVAARTGHADVVRELLALGVGAERSDAFGNTVLILASRGGYADVVRVLVEEGGVDVNRPGGAGWTPLHDACGYGKEDVVRVLLELGADVGVRNEGGETGLDVARRCGFDNVVRLLEDG